MTNRVVGCVGAGLVACCAIAACASGLKPLPVSPYANLPPLVKFDNGATCLTPAPDQVVTGRQIEQDVEALGRAISYKGSDSIRVQRLRESLPDVDAFDRMEFRLCLARGSGTIDNATYRMMIGDLLAKYSNQSCARSLPADAQGLDGEQKTFLISIPPATAFPLDPTLSPPGEKYDYASALRIAKSLAEKGLYRISTGDSIPLEAFRQYQHFVEPTARGNAVSRALADCNRMS